jgi:hypothetical protein
MTKTKLQQISHQLRKQNSQLLCNVKTENPMMGIKVQRAMFAIDTALEEIDGILYLMEVEKEKKRKERS